LLFDTLRNEMLHQPSLLQTTLLNRMKCLFTYVGHEITIHHTQTYACLNIHTYNLAN